MLLSPQNPSTTAFVVRCLQAGAIDAGELRAWAEAVLVSDPDCPIYVEALTEFDGPPEAVFRWIGFVPKRDFSAREERAIEAIAALRRASASGTEALQACPSILEEFRRTFPRLPLPGV